MKKIIALGSVAALLVTPLVSSAATYHYLDIYGQVNTIEAPSASVALSAVNASNETIHSGVKLDTGLLDTGEVYAQEYWYVSTSGETKSVMAASLDAARVIATDRAPTSGFYMLPS